MDTVDQHGGMLLGGPEEAVQMAADTLMRLFRTNRVGRLFRVTGYARPERGDWLWRVTKDTSGGLWPWPSVALFGSWDDALGYVQDETISWCKAELKRKGYRIVVAGVLRGQTWTRERWSWEMRDRALGRAATTRMFATEDEAWLDAWHHYKRKGA